uniref:6-pyruvoyltetrahydropterin synthase n=1 Tax=Rhabditophanes sp. KR3021 TaxID=114890 RepID=A0AC35U9H2_9BILA
MSTKLPTVYLKRVETFSACHRLHSVHLTIDENKQIFSKCNNPNGHGHNYEVTATLKGPVDQKTGMVYNLSDLKKEMGEVVDLLDHKNIDKDVAYFVDNQIVSTTENVTIFIYNELKARLIKPQLLYEVEVKETNKNVFVYRGE